MSTQAGETEVYTDPEQVEVVEADQTIDGITEGDYLAIESWGPSLFAVLEEAMSKGDAVKIEVNTVDGKVFKGTVTAFDAGWLSLEHDAGIIDKAMRFWLSRDHITGIVYRCDLLS